MKKIPILRKIEELPDISKAEIIVLNVEGDLLGFNGKEYKEEVDKRENKLYKTCSLHGDKITIKYPTHLMECPFCNELENLHDKISNLEQEYNELSTKVP